ncbi:MAG: alcohol dehydrogenase catalytic domain-containing protein, partial [bacterium]
MRAAFLVAPKTIEIREIPRPDRRNGELLVRVRAGGVCGSDLHFYSEGRIEECVLKEPIIVGHEFSGVVEDPGEYGDVLPAGTRVAVEPSITCDSCHYCKSDRPNLCLNLVFVGFPPQSGGFAELISLPRQCLYPLPDSIRDEEGPLIETLAIALHTVELAGEVSGRCAAVLGAGPIGLLTVKELRRRGARVAYVTEPVPGRREAALSFGAEAAFDPKDRESLAEHRKSLDGLGPDLVVEAVGSPESYQQASEIVRRGGTVIYCGIYPHGSMPIDFSSA